MAAAAAARRDAARPPRRSGGRRPGSVKVVPQRAIVVKSQTRAGALAGVGLALDPEGNKSVLIQPSSFEKKNTLNVTFFGFFSGRNSILHNF